MPIYLGNTEIVTEYVDGYQLGEIFLGTTLVQANNESNKFIRAAGGNVTLDGDYKIHSFTTVGTSSFNLISAGSAPYNTLEYLIVAGGGGGGIGHITDSSQSGPSGIGGGAGGVITGNFIPTVGSFNAIVGEGGTGATNNGDVPSTSGKISSIFSITANSGSGATGTDASSGNGFVRGSNLQTLSAPGGGGASENGYAAENPGGSSPNGGNGGNGIASSITGTSVYYGGGGGGNPPNNGKGLGGLGGGGNSGSPAAGNGTANTGGGGGGGVSGLGNTAGNGGSGTIIIRYKYK